MSEAWIWREQSRGAWQNSHGQLPTPELYYAIGIGCLQRIADSLETLVARTDPALIKSREEHERREDRWLPVGEACEVVGIARKGALERLRQGRKKSSVIMDHVRRALWCEQPQLPFDYFSSGPIDLEVLGEWTKSALAYWDSVQLPERVGGDGTKKQARYLEWLSSQNGVAQR